RASPARRQVRPESQSRPGEAHRALDVGKQIFLEDFKGIELDSPLPNGLFAIPRAAEERLAVQVAQVDSRIQRRSAIDRFGLPRGRDRLVVAPPAKLDHSR